MTVDELVEALVTHVSLEQLQQFRPSRAPIVLPLLRALIGSIHGTHLIEFGSGEPLLLAKALVESGANVTAVDPALSDPRVEPGHVSLVAADLFSLPMDALSPADVTLSTLLFGAPLRQRARRTFWPDYRRGERPTEAQVQGRLREVECDLLDRLAAWTKPGGWTLHWSLERLFAASVDDWQQRGFEVVSAPADTTTPTDEDSRTWARYVLGGMLMAQRR